MGRMGGTIVIIRWSLSKLLICFSSGQIHRNVSSMKCQIPNLISVVVSRIHCTQTLDMTFVVAGNL